jgi:hypothetical protein
VSNEAGLFAVLFDTAKVVVRHSSRGGGLSGDGGSEREREKRSTLPHTDSSSSYSFRIKPSDLFSVRINLDLWIL